MLEIIFPTSEDPSQMVVETAKFITFSGGEEHINLKSAPTIVDEYLVRIVARLASSKDVMQLIIATDALKRIYGDRICALIPYLPYARQDRVCAPGDAFSLAAFAKLLNAQEYYAINTFDVHSQVAIQLVDNLVSLPQHKYYEGIAIPGGVDYLVSPDKGAEFKAAQWSRLTPVAQNAKLAVGSKIRDPKDGSITGTDVDVEDFQGGSCLIVDDICDGGRTFIELAKVLKERNAGKIYLYVSHGIFSKGIEPLIEAGISHIYTTDSFPQKEHPSVTIVHRFFKGETK